MKENTPKRTLGAFCLINALILFYSVVRFWPAEGEYGAGWGAKTMAVVAAFLALWFLYFALAMYWPKRYKSFWRWWNGGG